MSADAAAERLSWQGSATSVGEAAAAVARLNGEHFRHEHRHAATRALNFIVAPECAEPEVAQRVASLSAQHPSRTIILREHQADRLDAEVAVDCNVPAEPGPLGVCHDRATLAANRPRLEHADSLVAPLLLLGLPTVVWLPGSKEGPADAPLLSISDYAVLDSAAAEPLAAIQHAARVGQKTAVHDLAWGRLSYWRARIAATFEPTPTLRLLSRTAGVGLRYEPSCVGPALLLAGWIAARAGWEIEALWEEHHGRWQGSVRDRRGAAVRLALDPDSDARACGGVEKVIFHAGDEVLELDRGAASDRFRDVFVEALRPLDSYARGYMAAIQAVAGALRAA